MRPLGPMTRKTSISTELGTTALLMVRPGCDEAQVAAGLLEHSRGLSSPAGGQGHLRRRNPPA